MKKWLIPVIIIGILIVMGFLFAGFVVRVNNQAIALEENVSKAWGNVQTSYQRRNDLIGNLVKTVQGAADFERNTLREVIEARAKATATTINPENITPEQLKQFNEAQSGLSGALSRLLVSVERYPDLKANQNFLKLQDELTSTENTIQTARTRYNEAIAPYNNHLRTFPNSMVIGWLGFDGATKPYFDSEPGAEKPVDVDFKFD
ncbi:LemA family protein [Ascidiimonas sp. W6]|uniref:LemA family protein n=1 Tax=Ascidiimonas meishanensis TaxID=3128903 RepID=UPI0030EEA965